MKRSRLPLLPFILIRFFLPSPSGMGEPSDPGFFYRYFERRIALRPESGRWAVLHPGAAGFSASAAPSTASAVPHPVRGWWILRDDAAGIAGARPGAAAEVRAETGAEFVSPVFRTENGGEWIPTPILLVGFRGDVANARAEAILESAAAGTVLDRNWAGMPGVYRIRARAADGVEVLQLADALAEDPAVRFAEPDALFSGSGGRLPNDPMFLDGSLWGLHNTGQDGGVLDADMDAPEAWDLSTGTNTVRVLIIDTGVQQDHPDINQDRGIDVTSDESTDGGPVNRYDNHGTMVAGCVTAIIDNRIGIVGIAPDCRTVSARTFIGINDSGGWSSQPSWTVASLAWAETNGIRITNNSNYYDAPSAIITEKYNQTRAAGMIHFGITGNNSRDSIIWPGTLASVHAVGAINRSGMHASWANYGPGISFTAPGEEIVLTDRTGPPGRDPGDYTTWYGTSFATPYAAGVAALILSVNPELSADEVDEVLEASCVDLGPPGYDTMYGYGLVNARRAIESALPHRKATLPDPEDGATNVPVEVTLRWRPAADAVSHDVYLGTDPEAVTLATPGSPEFLGNRAEPSAEAGPLAEATAYWWRVDEIEDDGEIVAGDLWGFTTVVPPGVTACWPLDGAAEDLQGKHPGVLLGGVSPAEDRFGRPARALTFDGLDGRVRIPDFDYAGAADPAFSLCFWFRTGDNSGVSYQYLFSHGGYAEPDSLNVFFVEDGRDVAAGDLRTILVLSDGTTWDYPDSNVPAGLADGRWHFYTLTLSRSGGTAVYVDGVLRDADGTLKGAGFDPPTDVFLGSRSDLDPTRFYGSPDPENGVLDDVCLYDRALSAGEVRILYERGPLNAQINDLSVY